MRHPPCEACAQTTVAWRLSAGCMLWRCPSCGHVIRNLADCGAGARLDPRGGRGGLDRIRTALTFRRIRGLLPDRRPLDVLEIGFGQGLMLSAFLKGGHRVSGIDPEHPPGDKMDPFHHATLYARPAEEVELPPESFDLIYGIHVVEHLEDPAAVFSACHRALRPDGLLYLLTPNAASKGLRLFGEAWWNLEDPTHVRFFTPRSIGLMLRKAGFTRGKTRAPIWDSLTVEISSLVRLVGLMQPGDHGVLGSRLALPLSGALLPLALAARLAWPDLSPSMEVMARKAI